MLVQTPTSYTCRRRGRRTRSTHTQGQHAIRAGNAIRPWTVQGRTPFITSPQSSDAATAVTALPVRLRAAGTLLGACRPLQWTKNLLVFAGILFSVNLDDGDRWVASLTCFAAYCAASSAGYLLNDVRDRAADAAHPVKRRRAIAAGQRLGASAVLLRSPLRGRGRARARLGSRRWCCSWCRSRSGR